MLAIESRDLIELVVTLRRQAEDSKKEASDSSECVGLKNYAGFCSGQASGFELAAKWLEELVLEV